MLYNSFEFMVIFAGIVFVYYLIPKRWQWGYLLLVSYGYYFTFSVKHAGLLLLSTVVTYVSARAMEKEGARKKLLLVLCTVLNIGLLGVFKYLGWLAGSLQNALTALGSGAVIPTVSLIAPVGISFYTFRVVSYIMDVYYGKIEAEKNFGKYALYVSFFPQLVSGPIERSYNFLHQLEHGYRFDYDKVKYGFLLFIAGMVKKIVVADRLAILVNQVFNNVQDYGAWSYMIAMLFYTFQIYFDFSGYTDMAVGCTNMLGMDSIGNFNRPYFATTIADFWRRWHMSLSNWFKDYVYIPLGGNRKGIARGYINLMIIFLLSGIWHGANWTFVVWGGMHGVFQVVGRMTKDIRLNIRQKTGLEKAPTLKRIWQTLFTFLCANYAWMFFRANSIRDALHITKTLILLKDSNFDLWNLGMGRADFLFSLLIVLLFFVLELLQEKYDLYGVLQNQKLPVRWLIYMAMIFLCIMFGYYGSLSSNSFVYFQF